MITRISYTTFIIFAILIITNEILLAKLSTSQIANRYSSSVVTIIALDENDQPLSLGSGFIINDKCDIVTNYHVLEGSRTAIIKTSKGTKGSINKIIRYSIELDLLIAETSLINNTPVSFGDSDSISVGEDIVAIGNPAGLEGSISKGIISGIRKINDYSVIQITAPISPGSSGGPVFNLQGKVIGIATAYLDYGQSLNFAMPINCLRNLKKANVSLKSLPSNSTVKKINKDNSLVQIFDVHYNYQCCVDNNNLNNIDFGIKNLSKYPIKNVILFFVYYNYKSEIISYSHEKLTKTILPQLALQFNHTHFVKYFNKGKNTNGNVEIRILDYEIDRNTKVSPVDLLF